MIENKAYIKITNKKDRSIIEEMLQETFNDVSITWNDNIGKVSAIDNDAFESKLTKLLSFGYQDVGLQAAILIVPFFDKLFIKYLDLFTNQVCTAFEIFVRNINNQFVKLDVKEIINKIEKKDMDTLKAFLSCNCNSLVSANELYLHRNSFNYRMNQLSSNNEIEIRDLNTIMFIKLAITLNS